jgi:hypothetical protein
MPYPDIFMDGYYTKYTAKKIPYRENLSKINFTLKLIKRPKTDKKRQIFRNEKDRTRGIDSELDRAIKGYR